MSAHASQLWSRLVHATRELARIVRRRPIHGDGPALNPVHFQFQEMNHKLDFIEHQLDEIAKPSR